MSPKSAILLFLFGLTMLSCATKKAKYYQHINAAYACITDDNYKKAVKHFKKSLRHINHFVADDQYNAFQAALKTDDIQFAAYNALKLAEKGMCYRFFQQYPKLMNNASLSVQLTKICSDRTRFNIWYADSLYRMMQEDQTIHGNKATYHLRRYTDSINFEELKHLIKQFGYPSEYKVGIECTSALKGFGSSFPPTLLTHFAMQDFQGTNELLKLALDSMYISPFDFLRFNAITTHGRVLSGGEIFYIDGGYYIEKPKSGTKAEINKTRKEYGLWPIEQQMKMIQKYRNRKDNDFRMQVPISIIPGFPPEKIDKIFIKIGEDASDLKQP